MLTYSHGTSIPLRRVLLSLLVFALLTPFSPAIAQSESDLRKQNQELTTRVRDLEVELDAARRQNEALQRRIAALEQQLAARSGTGRAPSEIPPEPIVTIDESKPTASPRALFAALQSGYSQAVANMPIGQPGDRDRTAYLRKLDRWRPAAEREFRSPIEWHIRIVHTSTKADAARGLYRVIAVDPNTDASLGDEFSIALSRTMATRLVDQENKSERGILVLKGTLVPMIQINPKRESRGVFDSPRFIGPFAEFDFTVEASSINAYRSAPESDPQNTATPVSQH